MFLKQEKWGFKFTNDNLKELVETTPTPFTNVSVEFPGVELDTHTLTSSIETDASKEGKLPKPFKYTAKNNDTNNTPEQPILRKKQ